MKKLILLLTVLLTTFTSCSSSEDDNSGKTNETGDTFNPPSWIIGTWKDDSNTITYTFTTDDILCTVSGTRLSFKDQATLLKNSNVPYSIIETKSNGSYHAEFKTTSTTIFNFTIKPDGKMVSDGYLSGTFIKQ